MRLQVTQVLRTGSPGLDVGITDMAAQAGSAGITLFATTGRNGGIAGWLVGPGGTVSLQSTVVHPPEVSGTVSDRLVVDTSVSAPRVLVGAEAAGLTAYGTGWNMALGARQTVPWQQAVTAASGGAARPLEAVVTMSPGAAAQLLPVGIPVGQLVELRSVTVHGRELVLVACAETDTVTAYRRNPQTGTLTPVDAVGAAEGLGIRAPTGMEVLVVGGVTYAVLVAAGTSSISVLRVEADGRLTPVEHLIDSGATRFAGVQAVAVAQVDGHSFVIAGGADHGVTLFRMLPDGRLVFVDMVADDATLSLANVSAIEAVVAGGTLNVFAGSQRDGGVTHLVIPAGTLGITAQGTGAGATWVGGTERADLLIARSSGDTLDAGAGADVLVSGPGVTTMRGGAGADVFVVRWGATRVDIVDFQRGSDRLDLSDLPMLRSVGQLVITPTGNGARIDYRGTQINLVAADGATLTAADLFPGGLSTPDRLPMLPRGGSWPGDLIEGGAGNDRLRGSGGDDQIFGGPGNDLIFGTAGNNTLHGGRGNDTIHGGPGNDSIFGSDGDDLIYTGGGRNIAYGGHGNDTIHAGDGGNLVGAGPGNDIIYGGLGNDTLWGGVGNDLIFAGGGNTEAWGGPGNDTIHGGPGNDTVGGGPGNDLVHGGTGNDTLWPGPGDDRLWGGPGADVFVFARGFESNRIMDLNLAEGDRLRLFSSLWTGQGALAPAQIVARFGSVNEFGNAVLDFGPVGGTVIILVGFNDLGALVNAIDIV
jgi:Ca2+-binding RTX toxin-like protein